MDKHLKDFASRHLDTKFIRLDAEKAEQDDDEDDDYHGTRQRTVRSSLEADSHSD
ncbi:conserved hypothetical protein [Ricinus communis]|uniref:Uncharacterized protein n=1 Tax=Ricinus communis TaxID=3988 RepID=B9SUJ4_RICCO|nr:conserved hypothetical protein [Ricinus communis]